MTSQTVESTWILMGGYGRFRGEWVKEQLTCIPPNLPAGLPIDQAVLRDSVLAFESHFVLLMS